MPAAPTISPLSDAERQRRRRERLREGIQLVTIELRPTQLYQLIEGGLLTADESLDPKCLASAISRFLANWRPDDEATG